MHLERARSLKARHTQDEMTQWTLVRSAKARASNASKARTSTARAKAKGTQEQDKNKDKDKTKDSIECWKCGKLGQYSKVCRSKQDQTNKGG